MFGFQARLSDILRAATLLPLLPSCLPAQTPAINEAAILKGKPQFLRGMWRANDLSFDCAGNPAASYPRLPFTESGIDIRDVSLNAGVLELRGERVGLAYDRGPTPRRVKLHWPKNGFVTLQIHCTNGADFSSALDAILTSDLSSLVPSPARYWALLGNTFLAETGGAALQGDELTKDLDLPGPTSDPAKAPLVAERKSMQPPRLLSQVDPTYSEAARKAHYNATVQVYLWVLPSGLPAHLRILKPAGLGLDEAALAAVAHYRFAPAKQNGVPMKVDLFIDVTFNVL